MNEKKKILLLNGPNLNMLGVRNPALYGKYTLGGIVEMVASAGRARGYEVEAKQSNSEAELIGWVQSSKDYAGIILNAGGYTHTSIALRDAVEIAGHLGCPTVVVHITDIHRRESFRHVSVFQAAPSVVIDQICGKGPEGYELALVRLLEYLESPRA